MKKYMMLILVLCMILSGCGNSQANNPETETAETVASGINTGNADAAITVYPLPYTIWWTLPD